MEANAPESHTVFFVENQWKFLDNIRSVDFVLAWEENRHKRRAQEFESIRNAFETSLLEEGLEIEEDHARNTNLHFLKIHAPLEVLKRTAEVLKLRLPMKEPPNDDSRHNNVLETLICCCRRWFQFDKAVFPECQRYTAVFSRDKEYLFDWEGQGFFSPANKSRIVRFILDRTVLMKVSGHEPFGFGVQRLTSLSVYKSAYPLHDGDVRNPGSIRHRLYKHWSSLRNWYCYQPLDYIKNYFGVKVGMYFAWIGFYTYMLVSASIVGLSCFLLSIFLVPQDRPTEDICSKTFNATMCPLCDQCEYWDLSNTCTFAKLSFLFDNHVTVAFAFFMSFWAVVFLQMWKRYSAEITHRWDLTGFDIKDMQSRPQYLVRLARSNKGKKPLDNLNIITNSLEPSWKVKFPANLISYSVVFLMISLAIATVFGVILYRMSVLAALRLFNNRLVNSYAIIITSTTAAFINLICILFFKRVYSKLVTCLTNMELHRTQIEFDDSLTLKMYLLQFVNYYSSIFYIAFFKGKFVGTPNSCNRVLGYRLEECGPGGCLVELSIQLVVIMVGKQVFNAFLEMGWPVVQKLWRSHRLSGDGIQKTQWENDYQLKEWTSQALFPEYLEMVLQYGFVTIFVSAFPLAPLFALINNILETRLDAKKLLVFHQRPVPERVKDIGVWLGILDTISKLAVVSNGFIIAFTSNFVPQLVYALSLSPDYSLTGFMNHSLAYMSTDDLDIVNKPTSSLRFCRYPGYREPAWSPDQYDVTKVFWHVLAARLAFVVLFENLVLLLVLAFKWLIPDIPNRLKQQIRRENCLINEIIITEEMQRGRRTLTHSSYDSDRLRQQELQQENEQQHRKKLSVVSQQANITLVLALSET